MIRVLIIITLIFCFNAYNLGAQDNYDKKAQRKELEQRLKKLKSGKERALDFTLKDINDKPISIVNYSGKWIVLDFWGTWNTWSIKDFSMLKKAYDKFTDKLVIIGINCKDSEEAWKETVNLYNLPWINLYNPGNKGIENNYGIVGYPTKVIISPQGIVKYITIGDDPDFFDELSDFIRDDDFYEEKLEKSVNSLFHF